MSSPSKSVTFSVDSYINNVTFTPENNIYKLDIDLLRCQLGTHQAERFVHEFIEGMSSVDCQWADVASSSDEDDVHPAYRSAKSNRKSVKASEDQSAESNLKSIKASEDRNKISTGSESDHSSKSSSCQKQSNAGEQTSRSEKNEVVRAAPLASKLGFRDVAVQNKIRKQSFETPSELQMLLRGSFP